MFHVDETLVCDHSKEATCIAAFSCSTVNKAVQDGFDFSLCMKQETRP